MKIDIYSNVDSVDIYEPLLLITFRVTKVLVLINKCIYLSMVSFTLHFKVKIQKFAIFYGELKLI